MLCRNNIFSLTNQTVSLNVDFFVIQNTRHDLNWHTHSRVDFLTDALLGVSFNDFFEWRLSWKILSFYSLIWTIYQRCSFFPSQFSLSYVGALGWLTYGIKKVMTASNRNEKMYTIGLVARLDYLIFALISLSLVFSFIYIEIWVSMFSLSWLLRSKRVFAFISWNFVYIFGKV